MWICSLSLVNASTLHWLKVEQSSGTGSSREVCSEIQFFHRTTCDSMKLKLTAKVFQEPHLPFAFYLRYSTSGATQYSRGSRSNGAIHEQRLPIQLEKIIGEELFGSLKEECVKAKETQEFFLRTP